VPGGAEVADIGAKFIIFGFGHGPSHVPTSASDGRIYGAGNRSALL
jgi:hypothetical protein